MRKLALALAVLFMAATTPAGADPAYLGTGWYQGTICPGSICCIPAGPDTCNPIPPITSPALNVSFPNGAGTATLAAGWVETYGIDMDANNSATCTGTHGPAAWGTHAYGTITYDDGEIAYSGAVIFDLVAADTTNHALPSGDQCCWQKHNPTYNYYQPNEWFVYKLKIQSCTSSHVRTTRFIAVGCDGYTQPSYVNDPNCPWWNLNYINLTVSGF